MAQIDWMREDIRRVGILVSVIIVAILCLLLHYYPPQQIHLPPCAFYAITGLYCPGCGSARALHHLMQFDLVTALQCNFFFVVLFPCFLYFLVSLLAEQFGIAKLPQLHTGPAMTRALMITFIVWWIVRNLPFDIFHIPAS